MKKLTKILVLMLTGILLCVNNAWGAEKSFTITFKDNGSDGNTALTASTFKDQVTEGADAISSVTTSYCYPGTGGLKVSANKNNGSFTLTLVHQLSITKVVLSVKNKNATTKTVTVGSTSFSTSDSWNTTEFVDLSFTGTKTTSNQLYVSLAGTANSARVAYLESITIYHEVQDAGGSSKTAD